MYAVERLARQAARCVMAGALAAAPAWLFAAHAVLAPLDYHVAFEVRSSRGLILPLDAVYSAEEALRFLGYVVLAAWIGRELWRSARDGRRAPTRPAGEPAAP
jgi:hypothetical protein